MYSAEDQAQSQSQSAKKATNPYQALSNSLVKTLEGIKVTTGGDTEALQDVTKEFPPTVVYKSRKDKGKNIDGTKAKDLLSQDQSKEQIIATCDDDDIKDVVELKEEELKEEIKDLIGWMTSGEMDGCVTGLFNRFYRGNGSDNENDVILTRNVKNHKNTKTYVAITKTLIKEKLWSVACEGNLNALKFNNAIRTQDIKELKKAYIVGGNAGKPIYDDMKILAELPLYVRFQDLTYPKYSEKTEGLALAIHDIWACEIEIRDYVINYSKKKYKGTYRFTIYDNFGLDVNDMKEHKGAGILDPAFYDEFQAWYVLQHLNTGLVNGSYKPFINKITIDEDFSGYVPFQFYELMTEAEKKARGK